MKISWKIFIMTYCIMFLTTALGGFVLVNSMYEREMEQAMEGVLKDNKTVYSYIMMIEHLPDSYADYSLTSLIQQMSEGGKTSIFVGFHEEWQEKLSGKWKNSLETGEARSGVVEEQGKRKILVTSRYKEQYIINKQDITEIVERKAANYELYQKIVILSSVVMAVILNLFSRYITGPLEKVTEMARVVTQGNYAVRVDASYVKMKSFEVKQLGETLNLMNERTENYIRKLKEEGRRKEEFMGNFTHELKTPLTSIIGYADLLRTYDLHPEKRREYSSFIYAEGKRLEHLALNLLQLIVMEKTELEKKDSDTLQLSKELKQRVKFLEEKYDVKVILYLEESRILAEPILLITVLMNLVDNACKASQPGQTVEVMGTKLCEEYQFMVLDHGRGMPSEEVHKIAEPFYMVDKSRARRQGGAGLGLTLCERIVHLHGGILEITSEVGQGTSVRFTISQPASRYITRTEGGNLHDA